jgi:hypothetical protein
VPALIVADVIIRPHGYNPWEQSGIVPAHDV